MSKIFFGIGSNINPRENIFLALNEIKGKYTNTKISPVYQNKSAGFEGDDFFNLVVSCTTEMDVYEVQDFIEHVHDLSGRKRGSGKFLSRTLDVDLLLYDQKVINNSRIKIPRDDILNYSFVLKPLMDIDPELIHPVTKCSVREHWKLMDKSGHPLTLIDLNLS
jgi:2-amino-4-hydroxy-6-hydroxymethyldihydropteridine diphosphokinase